MRACRHRCLARPDVPDLTLYLCNNFARDDNSKCHNRDKFDRYKSGRCPHAPRSESDQRCRTSVAETCISRRSLDTPVRIQTRRTWPHPLYCCHSMSWFSVSQHSSSHFCSTPKQQDQAYRPALYHWYRPAYTTCTVKLYKLE